MCQLVAAQTCLYGIRKTKTHRANHREVSLLKKKNLVGGSLFEMKNAVPDVDESDNFTSEEATLSDKRS